MRRKKIDYTKMSHKELKKLEKELSKQYSRLSFKPYSRPSLNKFFRVGDQLNEVRFLLSPKSIQLTLDLTIK